MFLNRKVWERHVADNDAQFTAIVASLKAHDLNVDEKHKENKRDVNEIKAAIQGLIELEPSIRAGVEADKAMEYKAKLFKRVVISIITTASVVGGIIPLVQWIASWHIQITHIGLE